MRGSRSGRTRLVDLKDVPEWASPVVDALNNHGDDLKALDGAISLARNTNCEVRELAFQMPNLPPVSGTINRGIPPGPSFLPGWTDSSASIPPGLVMLPGGEVRGFGSLVATGLTGDTVLIGLPEGWVPNQTIYLPIATDTLATVVKIETNRVVTYIAGPIGTPTISLEAIRFWAGPTAAPPSQFAGNGWPITVKHSLGKVLAGIVPMRCVLDSAPAPSSGHGMPYLDWANVNAGEARLNGAWGLQWGQRYRLTVLLVPQE